MIRIGSTLNLNEQYKAIIKENEKARHTHENKEVLDGITSEMLVVTGNDDDYSITYQEDKTMTGLEFKEFIDGRDVSLVPPLVYGNTIYRCVSASADRSITEAYFVSPHYALGSFVYMTLDAFRITVISSDDNSENLLSIERRSATSLSAVYDGDENVIAETYSRVPYVTSISDLDVYTEAMDNEVLTCGILQNIILKPPYESLYYGYSLTFTSGGTPTTFIAPSEIRFAGVDCADDSFVPTANKIYNIIIKQVGNELWADVGARDYVSKT